MKSSDYPHDPGYEFIPSKIGLGKRLLCSATEAGRILASGELKPQAPSGYKSSHYRTEDLDRCREPHWQRVKEKFAYLRGDELKFAAATTAEMLALAAGRTEPNDEDRHVGQLAAEKMTAKAKASAPGRLVLGARMNMKAEHGSRHQRAR